MSICRSVRLLFGFCWYYSICFVSEIKGSAESQNHSDDDEGGRDEFVEVALGDGENALHPEACHSEDAPPDMVGVTQGIASLDLSAGTEISEGNVLIRPLNPLCPRGQDAAKLTSLIKDRRRKEKQKNVSKRSGSVSRAMEKHGTNVDDVDQLVRKGIKALNGIQPEMRQILEDRVRGNDDLSEALSRDNIEKIRKDGCKAQFQKIQEQLRRTRELRSCSGNADAGTKSTDIDDVEPSARPELHLERDAKGDAEIQQRSFLGVLKSVVVADRPKQSAQKAVENELAAKLKKRMELCNTDGKNELPIDEKVKQMQFKPVPRRSASFSASPASTSTAVSSCDSSPIGANCSTARTRREPFLGMKDDQNPSQKSQQSSGTVAEIALGTGHTGSSTESESTAVDTKQPSNVSTKQLRSGSAEQAGSGESNAKRSLDGSVEDAGSVSPKHSIVEAANAEELERLRLRKQVISVENLKKNVANYQQWLDKFKKQELQYALIFDDPETHFQKATRIAQQNPIGYQLLMGIEGVHSIMWDERKSLAEKLIFLLDKQMVIENSKCRADIHWLEAALKSGQVPASALDSSGKGPAAKSTVKVVNMKPLQDLSVTFAQDREDRRDFRLKWLAIAKENLTAHVPRVLSRGAGNDVTVLREALEMPGVEA